MSGTYKKIAVLRANALGDFILSLPAIEALKNAHSEAEVVLLGRKTHSELYQKRRWPIDRVIPLPSHLKFDETLKEKSEEREALIESLRAEKFDLIVQLHGGGGYSNLFINELNAKFSVGAKSKSAPELSLNTSYVENQHETIRQMEIVQKVGAKIGELVPHYSASQEETELAKELFLKGSSSTKVLINPGATDPKRRWPVKKFVFICEEILKRGATVFINIGPNEEEIAWEIKKHLLNSDRLIFVTPKLYELTGLLSLCDLVLSNDTGTLHLALALQRPTIGLFWFKNLLTYGPLTSFQNKMFTSWETTCQECGQNCCIKNCTHDSSIIASIPEEEVMDAVFEFLNLK